MDLPLQGKAYKQGNPDTILSFNIYGLVREDGEMANQLRTLAALLRDLDFILNIHMMVHSLL